MSRHRTSLTLFLCATTFLFVGASCIRLSASRGEGGLFVSKDQAATWQQKGFVRDEGGKRTVTIHSANVLDFAQLTSDPQTMYLALGEDGLYRTSDAGEKWEQLLISKDDMVTHIAVDQKNKDTLYVVIGSRVARTVDGGKKWDVVYIENRPRVVMQDIQIDQFDPRRLYVVFSDGTINTSVDSGSSWSQFYASEDGKKVVRMLIHPKDTRVMTIATRNAGLFRTIDMGKTWTDLNEHLRTYKGTAAGLYLATDPAKSSSLFYLSEYGLLRTTDGGATWSSMTLLTKPSEARITAFTIDPKDARVMYYTTSTTLYTSLDSGVTWSTKALPTSYIPNVLSIDARDNKIVYLGGIKQ